MLVPTRVCIWTSCGGLAFATALLHQSSIRPGHLIRPRIWLRVEQDNRVLANSHVPIIWYLFSGHRIDQPTPSYFSRRAAGTRISRFTLSTNLIESIRSVLADPPTPPTSVRSVRAFHRLNSPWHFATPRGCFFYVPPLSIPPRT